jgi:hypothetical protein
MVLAASLITASNLLRVCLPGCTRLSGFPRCAISGPDFQSRPGHGIINGKPMNHHRDCGADNDFSSSDPAGWDRASYSAHPIDSMEPLSDEPNGYRAAALYHLQLMHAVDEFVTAAPDARLAVVAVAVVLGWPSARGLTVPEIAEQLSVSTSTIARACARFKTTAGLAAGGRCSLYRQRCRVERRQAGGGSGVGNIPREPGLYRMVKSTPSKS